MENTPSCFPPPLSVGSHTLPARTVQANLGLGPQVLYPAEKQLGKKNYCLLPIKLFACAPATSSNHPGLAP